jgi:hypothetical protein
MINSSIQLQLVTDRAFERAQTTVTEHHYLHTPVDDRCSPLAYKVVLQTQHSEYRADVLIFGRPEATRCYVGKLTYGSLKDIEDNPAAPLCALWHLYARIGFSRGEGMGIRWQDCDLRDAAA